MKKHDLRAALDMLTVGKSASVPETLRAEAIEVHKRATPWRTGKQIQGFGIGYRRTEGKELPDLSLKVYVEKKKPKSELGDELVSSVVRLPELGVEVNTDVEEIGKVQIEMDTLKNRPAPPGCGIGHLNVSVGTLGCLVRRKDEPKHLYILSNSHVIADSGLASVGDVIIQPGTYDGGSAPKDVIATLSHFEPFDFSANQFLNLVDAAIAKVNSNAAVTSKIRIINTPPTGVGVARIGTRVVKVGRTTDQTFGQVLDTDFRTVLKYPRPNGAGMGQASFRDQVLCTRYTAGGDSGSAVLSRDTKKIVGLHFAGSPSTSIFNKIHNVLHLLDIDVVTDVL